MLRHAHWPRLALALLVFVLAGRAAVAAAPNAAPAESGRRTPSDEPVPPPRVLLGPPSDKPVAEAPSRPPQPGPAPLTLAEVLRSVHAYYPLVAVAEHERTIAEGKLLSSYGNFDLGLQIDDRTNHGTYDNNLANFGVNQPLAFMGASVFAGYRQGEGLFPTYYLNRLTADGGEFRAGVLLPLLRDRSIDARRANLWKSILDRDAAEPSIQLQRIDIARNATRAYWYWVAAGRRVQIARQVLEIALKRDQQLAQLIQQGRLAPIERVDNRRSIVGRQATLVSATRALQQAAIALSLYLRDAGGNPLLANVDRLPEFPQLPELPSEEGLQRDLQAALARRPELQKLSLLRQRNEIELRQAENQILPALNLSLRGAQDVGGGVSPLSGAKGLNRAEYEAALVIDMPVQRREARGKVLATRGNLAQIQARLQMARDRVAAELRDAVSIMRQAAELEERARVSIDLTRQMEQAEASRYQRGQSNLLLVTIREMMTAEAQSQQVDAVAEFYRGLAEYLAAIGVDPSRPANHDALNH